MTEGTPRLMISISTELRLTLSGSSMDAGKHGITLIGGLNDRTNNIAATL
jgi:hypothetical protein